MFNGQFASKRKVALGGRSRQAENREQALQRAREDRERRRKQREEQKAATAIQAWYRGRKEWRAFRASLRLRWAEEFAGRGGASGEGGGLAIGSRGMRELLAFCDPARDPDFAQLVAVCSSLPAALRSAAGPGSPLPAAKRLAELCLRALHFRGDLRDQLVGRAPETPSLRLAVEALLILTDPGQWPPSPGAPAAAAAVVLHAAAPKRDGSDLFGCFRQVLAERRRAGEAEAVAAAAFSRFGDLLQRFLEANSPFRAAPAPDEGAADASARVPPAMVSLLCIPAAWSACAGLRKLAAPLWRRLILELPAGPATTTKDWEWLPSDPACPGGQGGAATALLGNLLEVTSASLRTAAPEEAGMLADHACGVFLSLLAVVPIRAVIPPSEDEADAMDEDEDEEDAGAAGGSGARRNGLLAGSAELEWDGREPPPPQLRKQLEALFDAQLLSCLVEFMLPTGESSSARGEDTPMAEADPGCGDAKAADEALERSVRQLCMLLYTLISLSRRTGNGERILSSLAFSAGFVQRLWSGFLRKRELEHSWRPAGGSAELSDPGWMLPLAVLCPVYSCTMNSISGDEGFPLPQAEIYSQGAPGHGFLGLLKFALWQLLWAESSPPPGGWSPAATQLRSDFKISGGRLLRHLHDRNVLRRFAPAEAFLAEELSHDRFSREIASALSARGSWDRACASASRAWAVLQHAPCLVPFQERARVFQQLVSADRREVRERAALHMGPNTFVTIRRDQIVSDGFKALNGLGDGLKEQIRVLFVNRFGEEEAGVDGGGLFKDFIGEVVKTAFDTRYGFFKTTSDNRLYPNSAAGLVHENPTGMFEFLGRILGKAIYEGILLELPLAGFFLKKFQSLRRNDINDLPSLDPELYKQLMFLRSYEGDVSDLALTFSITDAELGHMREVDLVPGGSSIPVTNQNRISYIFFVANYRLNRVIAPACSAFLRGVHELIPPEWLQMFNEDELRMLICGSTAGIDLEDLKAHIQYAGGYHEDHPVIHVFWEVMNEMRPEHQEAFLRFITSCSRPPLLGFEYLEPNLCIQMSGSMLDEGNPERLPTASTCVNLLKLPPYRTKEAMREKLLYAVTSGAGFDLS